MKTLFTIIIMISIALPVFSQNNSGLRNRRGMGKIEELEKIKLIDALQMNEETTLKFFARRNEFQNKVKDLNANANAKLDKVSEYIKSNGDKNSVEMKKMINEYLAIGEQVAKEKTNFINSLNDILSYEQISKLLVFEKHFREELRKMLLRQRMKH